MAGWTRRRVFASLALALLVIGGGAVALSDRCWRAWWRYGMRLEQCPDGEVRPAVELRADGLEREIRGAVRVRVLGFFANGKADQVESAPITRFETALFLEDSAGKRTALPPGKDGWSPGNYQRAEVTLPALGDGDYHLVAQVRSAAGEVEQKVALPLYAPARVHVLTDRPLYQPGQVIRFRALVVRAEDLAPLDGRPGTWTVTGPNGDTYLEERAPAGGWGVVAGSFPLDPGAEVGTWNLRWTSGGVSDSASFRVEPFTLPRFRVEATPQKSFYRAGEKPVVSGKVIYSSGVPVMKAQVELSWSVEGAWPAPREWQEGALPKQATTDAQGRFTLTLPQIPADLRGRATLAAKVAAIDAAGDRVESSLGVLLSEDAIRVDAVTELGALLMPQVNNRMYVRATSADGRVLTNTALRLTRAWDPRDEGIRAITDEDGVASFQVDPGTAINVVVPPMPVRAPKKERAVSRSEATELLTSEEPSLGDQLAMDGFLGPLEKCAWLVSNLGEEGGDSAVSLKVQVASSGAVVSAVSAEQTALARCTQAVLREQKFKPGPERLYALGFQFSDEDLPQLSVSGSDDGEQPALESRELVEAILEARRCVPTLSVAQSLPKALVVEAKAGQKELRLSWIKDPQATVNAPYMGCIESHLAHVTLATAPAQSQLGLLRFTTSPPARAEQSRPQATTFLGFEFKVAADGLGATKLILHPGEVPGLRLRASPAHAKPGERIAVDLLRGPEFVGELPKTVYARVGGKGWEVPVDPQRHNATVTIPDGARGYLELIGSSGKVLVQVDDPASLALELTPDHAVAAPGALVHLAVHTTVSGKDGAAAVGLFGVDESLGQLAALPGAEDLGRIRPVAAINEPAFGVLDGAALAMGRIHGQNAMAAALLRVAAAPVVTAAGSTVTAFASAGFDRNAELADHFYGVLDELHAQARTWEEHASKDERMTPALLAKLWSQALRAAEEKHLPTTDAFGRTLRLSLLPSDLLALTDPRQVVINKTRLPEDMENWQQWVTTEEP